MVAGGLGFRCVDFPRVALRERRVLPGGGQTEASQCMLRLWDRAVRVAELDNMNAAVSANVERVKWFVCGVGPDSVGPPWYQLPGIPQYRDFGTPAPETGTRHPL